MKKNSITAVALCILLSGACHKQNNNTGYTSLNDFFQKNQTATQHFSFTGNPGTVIQLSRGTKIHFPQNALIDQNNAVVSGQVDVEAKQLLTPSDMILNDMPSMSNLLPLESGGEFFIRATANGKELRLASGKKVQIELPDLGVTMNDMKVFNGYAWAASDSLPRNISLVNWKENTNSGITIRMDTVKVYNLFCDSLKWINCDRFSGGATINYHVLFGNCPSAADTRVFIHFTGLNSVLSLWRDQSGQYFSGHLIAAPVTIAGICIRDGRLWASVTKANLQDGQSSVMNFSETNEESLKATLSALK